MTTFAPRQVVSDHRCPVCRQAALADLNQRIRRHRDGAGHPCPASGQPYRIVHVAQDRVA